VTAVTVDGLRAATGLSPVAVTAIGFAVGVASSSGPSSPTTGGGDSTEPAD
jgi:hypothetical protein